jgi:predicted amidohydrolase
MVNLVAVQPEVSLADYASAETFRDKILGLTEEAVAGLPGYPALVAFPELIGFPLLLMGHRDQRLIKTIKKRLTRSWKNILIHGWQHRFFGLSLMYLPSVLPAYEAYTAAFKEAAKTFKVTIVAGSSLLPYVTHEPGLGLHIAHPKVYNTSFIFSPTGNVLGQIHKVHLTPGLESQMGLSRGRLQDLKVFQTPVGKVGVAICLDAFHDSVIGQLDGLGAEIVVQPSANNALWNRPWPKDNSLTEGEAWCRYGLKHTLLGTQNLRYGVNPMLIGDLWDLRFEGLSSILESNHDSVTILSQAGSIKQTLVKATVDVKTLSR